MKTKKHATSASKPRVLITGAAGSIGSELCRQLYKTHIIYGLDQNESELYLLSQELGIAIRVGDIRDTDTVRNVFDDFKPDIVYHAAAYKHVSPMEVTPLEAIKTNILGLHNVLEYSKIYETKRFVFISTDKAINSNSIMGATKRVGEIMVKNSGRGYIVVRFGNVLGSRGSLIPIWQKQINSLRPITVTDAKMERYMMTIEEAVGLVIKAGEIGKGGEIILFEMGKPIQILELAKQLVNSLGRDIPIKVTGIRAGETLDEKLMTLEEQAKAIKKGQFYVIK
jgi:FlaA1/EpsC-like NDP-sugar epimerase